tara:strand:- start:1642 stop:1878 length:237 start_codon:yes stop_codon:yes gene_type:complete
MYWRDWSYGRNTINSNLRQSLLKPKKQSYFEHYCCFCDKKEKEKETKYVNNVQSSVYVNNIESPVYKKKSQKQVKFKF